MGWFYFVEQVLFLIYSTKYIYCHDLHTQNACVYVDYMGKDVNVSKIGCPQNNICKKSFNISYIKMIPYDSGGYDTGTHEKPIEKILKKCCGTCAKFNVINNFLNITEINPSSINTSHFVHPFLGSPRTVKLYGYHFIPALDAPYAIYITPEREINLFQCIIDIYPLFIMCLLLALLSGFVLWVMETRNNEEEFPKCFITGWFQGFWCSFITMTTIGYGDKTPRSLPGRLFLILWICIGLVSCGLLTATLTTTTMNLNSPPPEKMAGKKVGVLRYRDYDAILIAKHGGIAVETKSEGFQDEILSLIQMVQNKRLSGFLLDKYALWFATHYLKNISKHTTSENKRDKIDFFLHNTIRTRQTYDGEKLSYGMLVKDKEDYEYFRDVISDNRFHEEREAAEYMNIEETETFMKENLGRFYSSASNNLFSPSGKYFLNALKVISVIIAIMCISGTMYELRRKNNLKNRSREGNHLEKFISSL